MRKSFLGLVLVIVIVIVLVLTCDYDYDEDYDYEKTTFRNRNYLETGKGVDMGRMEMTLQPRMEQRLIMAPQIIQSIEILQLPLLALQARVEQEQLENPVLELEEPAPEEDLNTPRDLTRADAAEVKDDFQRIEQVSDDFHDYFWQTTRRRPVNSDRDAKLEAIQNTPGPEPSLRDHLIEQLCFLDTTDRLREVCIGVVNNLNRDGRLSFPLEEIAASLDDPPTLSEAQDALKLVQSLDPAGVGARDLQECLLLQLDPTDADYALQREIVLKHLADVEANRFPKIADETGRDLADVKAAVGVISLLHPAPGRIYDNEVVPTIMPDVHVELVDDKFEVHLDEGSLPHLRISPEYRQMLTAQDPGPEARQFLQKKMESARWLIDSIRQRRRTILKVSREIVRAQREFLEKGISALHPLKMQEVADAIAMHVATVSRAIKHKYIQTPRGLFLMKFFFTGGIRSDNGEMESWDAVKHRIHAVIENEDKKNPLSDEDIVSKLAAQGVHIARRTVTKYRKALEIPTSRQRRQY